MVVGCVGTGYVLRVELPVQMRLCLIFVRDVGSPDIHECFRGLMGSQRTPGIWASHLSCMRIYFFQNKNICFTFKNLWTSFETLGHTPTHSDHGKPPKLDILRTLDILRALDVLRALDILRTLDTLRTLDNSQ